MTGKTHNAFALASLATAFVVAQPINNIGTATLVFSLIGVTIGALIPDMDQAGNDLYDVLPAGNFLGKFVRRIFYKHRTLSHSLLGGFLIYKFLDFILFKSLNNGFLNIEIILASIMIGFASHLLSDSLTEEGVPLLFPIPLTFGIPPIKSVRIKTGHWFENFIVFPAVWIYLVYLIHQNQNLFLSLL